MKTTTNWHIRFTTQLKWTISLRELIYTHLFMVQNSKILEPGCGTGALLTEIGEKYECELYGIDIDEDRLKIAQKNLTAKKIRVNLACQDILNNEFPDNMFDYIFTHYFFLWIQHLKKCFKQLHRILKSDGHLVIFAEPDYGGLIEHPNCDLKDAICSNLQKQDANPYIGREIPWYFEKKFQIVDQFNPSIPWLAMNRHSQLLEELHFLSKNLPGENPNFDLMRKSINNEKYFLYIPVFTYVLKKIPDSK